MLRIPKPGIPEDTIQHLLLDQVIPLVINLRGGEALHASAVLTSYGVVAFAGPAGSDKSTVAGSLLKEGYPFVSDDCLTLLEKNQEIYTIPAYPGLRLWDDAREHLFGENGSEVPRSSHRPRGPLARRELRGIQFSKELSSPLMPACAKPLRRRQGGGLRWG